MRNRLPGDAALLESVGNRLVGNGHLLCTQIHTCTTSIFGRLWQTKSYAVSTQLPLLLAERHLLPGAYLTSVHGIAVGQVQGGDRVVRQQLVASFEGGTRLVGIARVEQPEGLVKRRLRGTLRGAQRRRSSL